MRERIVGGLEHMGIRLDPDRNAEAMRREIAITTRDSPIQVLVVPTNEELMIARDTRDISDGVMQQT